MWKLEPVQELKQSRKIHFTTEVFQEGDDAVAPGESMPQTVIKQTHVERHKIFKQETLFQRLQHSSWY